MASAAKKEFFEILMKEDYKNVQELITNQQIPPNFGRSDVCNLFYICAVNCKKKDNKAEKSLNEFKYILNWAITFIDEGTPEQLTSILSYLAHILSFMLKLNNWSVILEMKDFIIPRFINKKLTDKQKTSYQHCCNNMHNYYLRVCTKLSPKECEAIGLFIFEMYIKIMPFIEVMDTKIVLYMQVFSNEAKLKSYETFLKLIDPLKVKTSEEVDKIIVKLLWHSVFYFWFHNFDNIKKLFKITTNFLSKLPESKYTILIRILNNFIHDTGDKSNYNKIDSELKKASAILKEIFGKLNDKSILFDDFIDILVQMLVMAITNTINAYKNPQLTNLDTISSTIGEFLLLSPITCTCTKLKSCKLFHFFKLHLSLLLELQYLLDKNNYLNVYNQLLPMIERAKNIQIYLKDKECKNTKKMNEVVIPQLHYFLAKIYKIYPERDFSNEYKAFIALIHIDSSGRNIHLKILSSTILILSKIFQKKKKYAHSLAVTAYVAAINESLRNEYIHEFHLIQKESKLKGTVVEILEKHLEVIREMDKTFSLSNTLKIQLLITELSRRYDTNKNRLATQIMQMNNVEEIVDFFIKEHCTKIIYLVFDKSLDLMNNLHERYEKVVKNDTGYSKHKIKLALLLYTKYKCLEHSTFNNKLVKIQEKQTNEEVYEIVTMYDHLQIKNHLESTKILHKVFEIIQEQANYCKVDSDINISSNYSILDLLVRVIEDYRFNIFINEYMQACFLLLKLARLFKNSYFIIHSISMMMEVGNLKAKMFEQLINEADQHKNIIKKELDHRNRHVLCCYYLCMSKRYILLKQFEESELYYKKALELYQILPGNLQLELKYRFTIMKVHRLLTPCEKKMDGHNVSPLMLLQDEFTFKNSWIQNEKYTLLAALCFEASKLFAEILWWLKLPKQLLNHCREMLTTMFKFSQPLQISYTYFYLAQSELLIQNVVESRAKINGINYILDMSDSFLNKNSIDKEPKILKEIDNLVILFENIMTKNNTNISKKVQNSAGSPILTLAPYKLPEFIHHLNECDCFACMNIDYNILIIGRMYLDIICNALEQDFTSMEALFTLTMKMYLSLRSKTKIFNDKTAKFFPNELGYDINNRLCEIMGLLLLEYGSYLLRQKNLEKASSVNKLLISLLEDNDYFNPYLNLEIKDQRCCIILCELEEKDICNLSNGLSSLNISPGRDMKSPVKEFKTPTKKLTKVSVDTFQTPDIVLPRKRIAKPRKFDIKDCEENENVKTKVQPSSTTKTPMSRIKVYADEKPKSTRKLKEAKQNGTSDHKSKSKVPKLEKPSTRIKPPTIIITPCETENVEPKKSTITRQSARNR